MSFDKVSGNMYKYLITHTWRPIKGKCPHACPYCFMNRFPLNPIKLDEKALRKQLGTGKYIFVGSTTDMWAEEVSKTDIMKVLLACSSFPENQYLFQSKNPGRFLDFLSFFEGRDNLTFATTIESDIDRVTGGPSIDARVQGIIQMQRLGFPVTVTIEPIQEFDLNRLKEMMDDIEPAWISIGADSQRNNLPEPSKEEVLALIRELERNHKVIQKDNLRRIIG